MTSVCHFFIASSISMMAAAAYAQHFPDYYPDTYADLIEASRSEGAILVYSNMGPNNWAPVIDGFQEHYPWIEVETLDLGSGEVFSRFEAEAASGASTADMLVSVSPDRWLQVAEDRLLADYESPETVHIPDFATAPGGVYTISTDPLVLLYNTRLIEEDQRPTSLESLVELATADPETFDKRVTSYEATDGAFALTVWRATLFELGEPAWGAMEQLAPLLQVDFGSTSSMVDKVASGEYIAAYLLSGISVFPALNRPGGDLLGLSFPDDGTPVVFRGMAVTKAAENPSAARLFLDYIVSAEGQVNVGRGGLTPYREDIDQEALPFFSYQMIADMIGEENIIRATYNSDHIAATDSILERWRSTVTNFDSQ